MANLNGGEIGIFADPDHCIAIVHAKGKHLDEMPVEDNAKLIAAAPDLLKVLTIFACEPDVTKLQSMPAEFAEAVEQARAVIAFVTE